MNELIVYNILSCCILSNKFKINCEIFLFLHYFNIKKIE